MNSIRISIGFLMIATLANMYTIYLHNQTLSELNSVAASLTRASSLNSESIRTNSNAIIKLTDLVESSLVAQELQNHTSPTFTEPTDRRYPNGPRKKVRILNNDRKQFWSEWDQAWYYFEPPTWEGWPTDD